MAIPDATAGAALAAGNFFPAWVAWLDISGDPVRVTTAPASISFSATGDSDLDGFTFDAVDPQFVAVTPVTNKEGGSDTMTATLSGIVGPDTTLLNAIGNKSNWQGRSARFWSLIYNEAGVQQGAVWNIYTGRMSAVRLIGSPSSQTVEMEIEGYLSSLKQPSNRSYLNQEYFDSGDLSSRLKIGTANGAIKGVGQTAPLVGGGGSENFLSGTQDWR